MASLRIITSFACLSAALVACGDGTTRPGITAPDARAPLALAASADDHAVIALGADGEPTVARVPRGRAADGLPPQAANVGGAVAHVHLSMGPMTQEYSLQARSAHPFPGGRGQLKGTLARDGYRLEIEADVDCLTTDGNVVWVSGPIRRFVSNGVQREVTFHILARVAEASDGSPATASALYGTRPGYCATRPELALLPNEGSGIQVR